MRTLRRTNAVISYKVKALQISDHVGDSPHEQAADMNIADLRHYVDIRDFDCYINTRDLSIPPLGLMPGGDQGQHGDLGHGLTTSKQFGDDQCVTFFNERIMVSTLVGCVKSCWDKQYHVSNPERGHYEHRKFGVVLLCYKVGYAGGSSQPLLSCAHTCVMIQAR